MIKRKVEMPNIKIKSKKDKKTHLEEKEQAEDSIFKPVPMIPTAFMMGKCAKYQVKSSKRQKIKHKFFKK